MRVFPDFPKQRPELPDSYKKIYTEHYIKNRLGQYKTTSLSSKLEKWLHVKVAQDIPKITKEFNTLEIGAGSLNQLEYEKGTREYDIIEPFSELYENSPYRNSINSIFNDIDDIPLSNKYYRITGIASFEHILNLPHVVAKSALLLSPGGSLRVSIPNEGTLLWTLGTKITGFEFKKLYNLEYNILMKYEHVNSAMEIEEILKYFYKDIKYKVFGISKKLAFYRFYECTSPILENVEKYLEKA